MPVPWSELPGNVRGAAWILFGALMMSVQSVIIKALGEDLHSLQIAFFRCVFGLPLVLPMLIREGGPRFRLSRLNLHVTRSICGLSSMAGGFYAYTMLPLAEATTFTFTMPLFMLVLGALVLREQVGWRRAIAAMIGFAGVMLVLRPGANAVQAAALIALASAFFHACVGVLIKKLAAIESPGMIVLYFNVFGTLVFLLPALYVWREPSAMALFWLCAVAVTGMASQLSFIAAAKVAEMTAVTPVDYSRLLFSTVLGFVFFAEMPDAWTGAGALVIILSTVYITRREMYLARLARQARLAEPSP